MSSELIFRQKITLNHKDRKRRAIFEMVVYSIPKSKDYPKGIKYRAWFSEHGETLFGFDNHKPKGHISTLEKLRLVITIVVSTH